MKKILTLLLMVLMLYTVSAFEINSPSGDYSTTDVPLNITSDTPMLNLSYSIDGSDMVLACENCTSYQTNLSVGYGDHEILAQAYNETEESSYFSVLYPEFSMDIVAPEDKVYTDNEVMLNITADKTLEKMMYSVDGSDYVLACESCSSYQSTLDLAEGNHNVTALGQLVLNKTETVSFSVNLPEENFDLNIVSPEAKEYDENVSINVESNTTLDSIRVIIGNAYDETCYNCSSFEDTVKLAEGTHTLRATGTLDNGTKEKAVVFTVKNPDDENDNETNDDNGNGHEYNESGSNSSAPRFTLGYEKLPQAVANGEISDADLAQIIRDNKLNPGILNRLIKTGMLGNQSLEAILDTQFKPMGLWNKILAFIGIEQPTYASEIYQNYNLPEHLEQKLVQREDLPKKYANQVKDKLTQRIQNRTKLHGQDVQGLGNGLSVGKEIAPGQAKKQGLDIAGSNNSHANNGKGNLEGQEKSNKGKSNGKGKN